MKFITMTVMALAFAVTAQAKPAKVPGAKVSRTTTSESKDYATSYTYGGGSYTHEIATSLTNGFYRSRKECKDCSSGTNLTLAASYLQYWKDNIQLGGEGSIRMWSKEVSGTGDSETLFDIMAIGAYNFDSDLSNSIYASAGIGFVSLINSDGDGYESKLGLFVGAGKRFAWLSNISYNPEIRLVKRGDIDVGIDIALLNFAVHW